MNNIDFILENNFDWKKNKKKVYEKIINSNSPVEVIWDLSKMTNIPPWYILLKQVKLMQKEKASIKKNIIKNTVFVSSEVNRNFLHWVFKYIYSPKNPTQVFITTHI